MTSEQHEEQEGFTAGKLDPWFVSHALQAHGFKAVYEQGLGYGYSMSIGDGETEARIGVFPQINTMEVVSGTSSVRLEKIVRLRRREEQVVAEALEDDEIVTLQLSPEGRVRLTRQLLLAADQPQASGRTAARDVPAFVVTAKEAAVEPPVSQHQARRRQRQNTLDTSATSPAQQRERGENERVTIRGRVGKEAHFRTTGQRGVLVGSFPLGEHPDLETTIWHTIVVFGDRAAKLKEKGLTPGQEVEIVGYVHEREIKGGKTDMPRTVK